MIASSISVTPFAATFSRKAGTHQCSIVLPIEIYIRTRRKMIDDVNRFTIFGVSRSFSASSSAAKVPAASIAVEAPPACTALPLSVSPAEPFSFAPYPARVTAAITSFGSAVPSTPIEFVSKDTAHSVTPGTLLTAFSTLA